MVGGWGAEGVKASLDVAEALGYVACDAAPVNGWERVARVFCKLRG